MALIALALSISCTDATDSPGSGVSSAPATASAASTQPESTNPRIRPCSTPNASADVPIDDIARSPTRLAHASDLVVDLAGPLEVDGDGSGGRLRLSDARIIRSHLPSLSNVPSSVGFDAPDDWATSGTVDVSGAVLFLIEVEDQTDDFVVAPSGVWIECDDDPSLRPLSSSPVPPEWTDVTRQTIDSEIGDVDADGRVLVSGPQQHRRDSDSGEADALLVATVEIRDGCVYLLDENGSPTSSTAVFPPGTQWNAGDDTLRTRAGTVSSGSSLRARGGSTSMVTAESIMSDSAVAASRACGYESFFFIGRSDDALQTSS